MRRQGALMPLGIDTFKNKDWRTGTEATANTLFKALGHPLVASKAQRLCDELAAAGPVAIYDPLGHAAHFAAFYDLSACDIAGAYVQRIEALADPVLGLNPAPVTDLARASVATVLIAAFDGARLHDQIAALVPAGVKVRSFDELRLPDDMLTTRWPYLAPLNFATNIALFREGAGDHTRISLANYWSQYGAQNPELWLCLFAGDGSVLAEWRERLPGAGGTLAIDSRDVRARFGLGDFAGSLFIHALGVAGHDIVKYALDTTRDDGMISSTHDANAWPADLYAGLPGPDAGERVVLWVQNSHPAPIRAGSIGLNLMGAQDVRWLDEEIPAFGSHALDVAALLPEAAWPQQIEVQAGRHFVRPRYEVIGSDGARRIAHANVERTDLSPNPEIPELAALMGKGYLMPLPVMPVADFRSLALPTPMADRQRELPLAIVLADASGAEVDRRYLGRIRRRDSVPVDVDDWLAEAGLSLPSGYGHVELLYDFQGGGEADGWLHAIGRYRRRGTRHAAETSFGAHIYNTPIVYRDEPQSYGSAPPGLSTRLFVRLGWGELDTLCHLIYPASTPWHPRSTTDLVLIDGEGRDVATRSVHIPCGGSLLWRYRELFDAEARGRAGEGAYVLVRDTTCRLFGFHGLLGDEGAFSLDHAFGF